MSRPTVGTLVIDSLKPNNVDGTQYLMGTLARECSWADSLLVKPRQQEYERICDKWRAGTSLDHKRIFSFLSFIISSYGLGNKHFASKVLHVVKRQQNGNSELIHNIHFVGFMAFKHAFDLVENLRAERKKVQILDFDKAEEWSLVSTFTLAVLGLTHLPHLQNDGREVMISGALDSINTLLCNHLNHPEIREVDFLAQYHAMEDKLNLRTQRREASLNFDPICKELIEGFGLISYSSFVSTYLAEAIKVQNALSKPLKPVKWSAA